MGAGRRNRAAVGRTTNPKARITTTVDAHVLRLLDGQLEGRGVSRSEAVAEAMEDWVSRKVAEDRERVDGLGEKVKEASLEARMVLEALRYQFPQINVLSDTELKRRARAGLGE